VPKYPPFQCAHWKGQLKTTGIRRILPFWGWHTDDSPVLRLELKKNDEVRASSYLHVRLDDPRGLPRVIIDKQILPDLDVGTTYECPVHLDLLERPGHYECLVTFTVWDSDKKLTTNEGLLLAASFNTTTQESLVTTLSSVAIGAIIGGVVGAVVTFLLVS